MRNQRQTALAEQLAPAATWPMTATARDALEREVERLRVQVRAPAETDADTGLVRLPEPRAHARLETLRGVLAGALVVDEPGVAVIGRRVVLEPDGDPPLDISLVLPGDGDALRDWVSADAPLGLAVLGARAGNVVTVRAPARTWTARVRSVR